MPRVVGGSDRLRADCDACTGLCCVAPALAVSADFALDKPPGVPCPHLGASFRCAIHDRLRDRGFPGCAAFDCFGAGQRVASERFPGADWRADPGLAGPMFRAFGTLRALHQGLWLLREARGLEAAAPLYAALDAASDELDRLAGSDAVQALDVPRVLAPIGALLSEASALARAASPGPRRDHRGADLAGADLRGRDLRGASLRSALLVGADLEGADLALTDLTNADLRGARLHGADLSRSLFVDPGQLAAAKGDARTALPPGRDRPTHWLRA